MERADFSLESPGRIVPAAGGGIAFVPSALPPRLQWTGPLAAALSCADRALGCADGLGQTLPNPRLMMTPFLRREAVLSSRIEGTRTTLSQLFLFEVAPAIEKQAPDVREVANYVRALEHGLGRLADLPVSLRLIRELHERLMTGVRGGDKTPGEFRRTQNWIGRRGCSVADATYVPPPPPEMNAALEAFEAYLHASSDMPPLVRAALIHYQFEAIHPFQDGNGRIGRLLITMWLCAEKFLSEPLLYLSAFLERHRAEYYQRLLAVSQSGQWTKWLTFFLNGVAEEAADTVERLRRLLALRERYHRRLQAARRSALQIKLVDALFVSPATTVARAAKALDVTPRAAQGNIDKLIAAGMLREVTGQKRDRVFVAEEIVRVIDEPMSADRQDAP